MKSIGIMKRFLFLTALSLVVRSGNGSAFAETFLLTSADIKAGATLKPAQVFNGFGCEGQNRSPALHWSGAPKESKSFAITVYDPDAPTGSGWWHWMVYNIPASASEIAAGAGTAAGDTLPEGSKQNRNDYGTVAFGGACPPPGDKPHRYIFTVFALNVEKIEVPADATAALTGYNLNAHAIEKASFTAYYSRPKP